MLSIWRAAAAELQRGEAFVLAVILSVKGSSPRHVGTRFLVRRDGSIVGTIGGGLFEARVQQFAENALKTGKSHRVVFSFTGPDAGAVEMICGGEVEVLLEFVDGGDKLAADLFTNLLILNKERATGYLFTDVGIPRDGESTDPVRHLLIAGPDVRIGGIPCEGEALLAVPHQRLMKPAQLLNVPSSDHPVFLEWIHPSGTVYIFGAGHVGACVAHLAAYVDFRVVVLDDRSDFARAEQIPDADRIVILDSFEIAFDEAAVDEESYLVIVTRGHAHDKTVLAGALKTEARYIGMIGSRRKTNLIYEALLGEGFTSEDLKRVHAPIGLPIGGETPQEIGMSIVAEMVRNRNGKDQPDKL